MEMIKDDVVFAQQGRDWAPFQKMSNYVLLSSEDAYQLIRLPGRKSPYHHGTAGDIDNDGDTDIIIVPGMENRIIAYINRGDGTFDFREVGGTKQKSWDDNERYFFASLWDLDDDGFLDLILGSQKSKTKIIWGTVPRILTEKQQSSAMIPTTILILSFAILTETA